MRSSVLTMWLVSMCALSVGVGSVSAKETKKQTLPVWRVSSQVKFNTWLQDWVLDCSTLKGTLREDKVIQGVAAKKGTKVTFFVHRQVGLWTGGRCQGTSKKASCKQCDRCAVRCLKKRQRMYPIAKLSLRGVTLAKSRQVDGIWFTKGTRLVFFADGTLDRVILTRSQPLRAKKTGVSLPFPRDIVIDFQQEPPLDTSQRLKIPTYRIFRLGKFTCFYEDGNFGVICRF